MGGTTEGWSGRLLLVREHQLSRSTGSLLTRSTGRIPAASYRAQPVTCFCAVSTACSSRGDDESVRSQKGGGHIGGGGIEELGDQPSPLMHVFMSQELGGGAVPERGLVLNRRGCAVAEPVLVRRRPPSVQNQIASETIRLGCRGCRALHERANSIRATALASSCRSSAASSRPSDSHSQRQVIDVVGASGVCPSALMLPILLHQRGRAGGNAGGQAPECGNEVRVGVGVGKGGAHLLQRSSCGYPRRAA